MDLLGSIKWDTITVALFIISGLIVLFGLLYGINRMRGGAVVDAGDVGVAVAASNIDV